MPDRSVGPPVFIATRYLRTPPLRVAVLVRTYRVADLIAVIVGAACSLPPVVLAAFVLPSSYKLLALAGIGVGGGLGWTALNLTDGDGRRYIERLRPSAAQRAPKTAVGSRSARGYIGTAPILTSAPRRVLLVRGDD